MAYAIFDTPAIHAIPGIPGIPGIKELAQAGSEIVPPLVIATDPSPFQRGFRRPLSPPPLSDVPGSVRSTGQCYGDRRP
jgi:hypothetical protein